MKKLNIALFVVLFGIAMMMNGCKKEKEDNCQGLLDDIDAAATAFGNNPSENTCEAYYDAIQDYYNGCAAIPPSLKAQYDAWLDAVDCSVFKK
jgi:hypothetical protein